MAATSIASRSTFLSSIFRTTNTTRSLISSKSRISLPNPNSPSSRFNTSSLHQTQIEGSVSRFLRRELSTHQPFHSVVASACLVSKLPFDVTSNEEFHMFLASSVFNSRIALLKERDLNPTITKNMGRHKEDLPAVRVYTVCDESRYLVVRNVPALGCCDDLVRLFNTYGEVEECKPMDAEDCEEFTDVYWIKFHLIANARFAKRKLDESPFLGNRLQISYAPEFETLTDTHDKLETRRKEVLLRLNPRNTSQVTKLVGSALTQTNNFSAERSFQREMEYQSHRVNAPVTRVSSDQEYFASSSMNQTVQTVREKLSKIQESGNQKRLKSTSQHLQTEPDFKRPRADNRRRI